MASDTPLAVKFLSFEIEHRPNDGPQKPAQVVIADDWKRVWRRVQAVQDSASSDSPSLKLVLPTVSPATTKVVNYKKQSLENSRITVSHMGPQISVHSGEYITAIEPSHVAGCFANEKGYGEDHVWVVKVGADAEGAPDYTAFAWLRIDTGSRRMMVFNKEYPSTYNVSDDESPWDKSPHKRIKHRYISPKYLTKLTLTDSSEDREVVRLDSYVGGTILYGNEYRGNLLVQGPSNDAGEYAMHEVRDVQIGGVSGATWDMVGGEMDGILGLEPNFRNVKADFIKQVALANRLTPDVFIDVYPESSLSATVRSRFQVGDYPQEMISGGEKRLKFLTLQSEGDRTYWMLALYAIGVGKDLITYDSESKARPQALADSGSVFSYLDAGVLDRFYRLIPGAEQTEDGIWTFPYPDNPNFFPKISVYFVFRAQEPAQHELSLAQFVWEKGTICAGQRVHGVFQKHNAKDRTVAELSSDKFALQILGQSSIPERDARWPLENVIVKGMFWRHRTGF